MKGPARCEYHEYVLDGRCSSLGDWRDVDESWPAALPEYSPRRGAFQPFAPSIVHDGLLGQGRLADAFCDGENELLFLMRRGSWPRTAADQLLGCFRSPFRFNDDFAMPPLVDRLESFIRDNLTCCDVKDGAVEPLVDAVVAHFDIVLQQLERSKDLVAKGKYIEEDDWVVGGGNDHVVELGWRVEEGVEPRWQVPDRIKDVGQVSAGQRKDQQDVEAET